MQPEAAAAAASSPGTATRPCQRTSRPIGSCGYSAGTARIACPPCGSMRMRACLGSSGSPYTRRSAPTARGPHGTVRETAAEEEAAAVARAASSRGRATRRCRRTWAGLRASGARAACTRPTSCCAYGSSRTGARPCSTCSPCSWRSDPRECRGICAKARTREAWEGGREVRSAVEATAEMAAAAAAAAAATSAGRATRPCRHTSRWSSDARGVGTGRCCGRGGGSSQTRRRPCSSASWRTT